MSLYVQDTIFLQQYYCKANKTSYKLSDSLLEKTNEYYISMINELEDKLSNAYNEIKKCKDELEILEVYHNQHTELERQIEYNDTLEEENISLKSQLSILEETRYRLQELETRQSKLDNLLSIADVSDLVLEF
jgi:hypothetical protein